MRILFMGTPDFARVSLQKLLDEIKAERVNCEGSNLFAGSTICGVVTQPDKPKGRGHRLQPPPVKELAIEYDIPIFQPETLKNGEFSDTLATLNPDIIIVVAYGKILPKYILDFPKLGCINVHASLLPKYRGAAPINWCVINGEKVSGITTMYMNEGLDTGDMILKSAVEIGDMTVGELHDKLAVLGGEVLLETLEKIVAGVAPREVQDDAESTYAPMISRETGRIDWSKSAAEICNLVRGTNPYPSAFTAYNGGKLKVFKASVCEGFGGNGEVGEVVSVSKCGLKVVVGDGNAVNIEEIQVDGGKRMTVSNYLNGNEIEVGTVLI